MPGPFSLTGSKIQFQFNLLNCHKKGIIYKTNIMKDACGEEAQVETNLGTRFN
jgi:hypothetical protein